MANFNFTASADYTLNTSMITEVIGLYGILVKFLIVEKINSDDLIYGDFSHLKTDNAKIFEINMLPDTSDDWDHSGDAFNSFGLTNYENISLYVPREKIIDDIPELVGGVSGNLIILPNNKIMEITSTMFEVPGMNNLFTETDAKSVLKLTCKPYDHKLTQELAPADINFDTGVDYTVLDNYFNELTNTTAVQDTATEITASVPAVVKTGVGIDTTVNKPIVDRNEDDVWGSLK